MFVLIRQLMIKQLSDIQICLLCYTIYRPTSFFNDLNVFFAPNNLGMDNKIIKFELIVS